MCGIAGSMNVALSPDQKQKMLAAIAHRGPDDSGNITLDAAWLANTRLAIQDLSHQGHQPMQSADRRFTIVYNGEIYNHWELRKSLKQQGVEFVSTSDTETLLQAYILYGEECLPKLNGIYAFAVYDALKKELFMARDPLGVKPFYYYEDHEVLLFSSELKALLRVPGLDYALNIASFYSYLTLLYQPGNSTPFSKIRKLLPGHCMRCKDGITTTPKAFYTIPFDGKYNYELQESDWVEAVDDALNKSVAAQLRSDAPVGYFLSGGLDSSLIAAIVRKQNPQASLDCFTIDTGGHFAKEGFTDDLPFARKVARQLGAHLHEVPGNIDLVQSFDEMIWQLDEPQADPAALFVARIASAARDRGIKVLLSGAGADDVFSGYRRHQSLYYEPLLNLAPTSFIHTSVALLKSVGRENMARRLAKAAQNTGDATARRMATHFWIDPEVRKHLFHERFSDSLPSPFIHFKDLLQEIPNEKNALNQMLFWEMRTFLPDHNLNYNDKMSMAAGIETRVPFLDTNLVALACSMPPTLKMKGAQTKYILRQVAGKYLPKEIIYRKKTGFGAPVRQWITGSMSAMVSERLLSGSLETWDIFNPAAIAQLIDDNKNGKVDGAYTIFSLLAIESWLRQFAPK